MASDTDSWARRIGMVVLFAITLPGTLIGLAAVLILLAFTAPYFWATSHLRERRFRRNLRQQGRLLLLNDVHARLVAGEGTILEEWSNKGPICIWWTAEDLAAVTPALEEQDLLQALYTDKENELYELRRNFNRASLANYIGGDSGKAALTAVAFTHTAARRFLARHPHARRVIVIPPFGWWQKNRAA